jgi:hypothetical protein
MMAVSIKQWQYGGGIDQALAIWQDRSSNSNMVAGSIKHWQYGKIDQATAIW